MTIDDDTPVLDRDALADSASGNAELMAEMAATFVDRHQEIAAPVRAAFERGDGEGLRIAAHGARGAAAIIGAPRVVAICATIEAAARARNLASAAALIDDLERELGRVADELARL